MKLHIHDSFWLLPAVLLFIRAGDTLPAFVTAAVVHECGHWATIRLNGGVIRQFNLSIAGGQMHYRLRRLSPYAELSIALGGPLAGLLFTLIARMCGQELFAGASLILSIFNLLPICPLDGGRALESIFPPDHFIIRICTWLSIVFVLSLGIYAGLKHGGWGLCLIGMMLLIQQWMGLHSIVGNGTI